MDKRKLPTAPEIAAMFQRCGIEPKQQSTGDLHSCEMCGCAVTALYIDAHPDIASRSYAPYAWCEDTYGYAEIWSLIAGFDGRHERGDPNDYHGNYCNAHAWLSRLIKAPLMVREAYVLGQEIAKLVFGGVVPEVKY